MGPQSVVGVVKNCVQKCEATWIKSEQHSYHIRNSGVFLHHHKEKRRKELVAGSRASMQMLSRKDLNSAELENVRVSRNSTKIISANDEVQTNKEARSYVRDLGLFVTVRFLEDTPPVLSLGQLCEDHGSCCGWTGRSHILLNMAEEFHATRRTSCLLLFQDSRGVLRVPVRHHRLPRLHHRTHREVTRHRDK